MTIGGDTTASTPVPAVKRASAAAKRKAEAKRPETLDEAIERLSNLKWTDAERSILDDVTGALRSGEMVRDLSRKLSKKEIVELADELREMRRQARLDELVRTKPDNYRIITTPDEFDRFIDDLYQEEIVSFDTETTGLDLFADVTVSYQFWMPNAGYGVSVPYGHTTGETQIPKQVAIDCIRDFLQDPNRKIVGHNLKFDAHMMLNEGVQIENIYFDTMTAFHILNENEMSHSLKALSVKYLGVEADTFTSLFGDDPLIYKNPVLPSGVYGIRDVDYTWQLYEFSRNHLEARDGLRFIFYEVEIPQVRISLEMERQGFALDVEGCKALEAEFEVLVDEALSAVHQTFGTKTPEFLAAISEKLGRTITEFNIASPEQLAFLVYDYLGLPDITKTVNPKLQPRSTAGAVLEKLAEIDERLAPLLDYREKEKLLDSFVRKFPEVVGPDGRLHYSLNPNGTETGRYSSSQYGDRKNKRGVNIQQLPARSKAGKKVRKLLVAG